MRNGCSCILIRRPSLRNSPARRSTSNASKRTTLEAKPELGMSSPLFGRDSVNDVTRWKRLLQPRDPLRKPLFLQQLALVTHACWRGVGHCIADLIEWDESWRITRRNPALTGATGGSLVTRVEEIIMHVRAPLAVTFLTIVWFTTCKPMSCQERPEGTGHAGEVRADTPALEELARHRDVKAADRLGWSYMTGTGVSQNYHQAAQWYRQAAEQGLADAEFVLGYLYEQGKGVGQDYRKAAGYYTSAARQGHPTAENNLASMYEHGQGVQKDLQEAVRWYRVAAEQGEVTAQCNLASLYFTGKGVAQSYSQAAAWFRAAAEHGYAPAQENLGWAYYTGKGAVLDFSEAAKWVRRAADQGYARAQLDLGFLYEQGKGVPLDYVSAYMWYEAASAGGEKRASARAKSLSRLMTQEQISTASAGVAKLPGSSSTAIGG